MVHSKMMCKALKMNQSKKKKRNARIRKALDLFEEERKQLPDLLRKAAEERRFGRENKGLFVSISLLARSEELPSIEKLTGVRLDDHYGFLKSLMKNFLKESRRSDGGRRWRIHADLLRFFKRKNVFRVPFNQLTPIEILLIRRMVDRFVLSSPSFVFRSDPRHVHPELSDFFQGLSWPRLFDNLELGILNVLSRARANYLRSFAEDVYFSNNPGLSIGDIITVTGAADVSYHGHQFRVVSTSETEIDISIPLTEPDQEPSTPGPTITFQLGNRTAQVRIVSENEDDE